MDIFCSFELFFLAFYTSIGFFFGFEWLILKVVRYIFWSIPIVKNGFGSTKCFRIEISLSVKIGFHSISSILSNVHNFFPYFQMTRFISKRVL